MNEEQCYLCSGKTEVLYNFRPGKKVPFKLLKCRDCRFLRIDPIPDQATIDKLYKGQVMSDTLLDKEVFSSSFLTSLKKNFIIKPLLSKFRKHFGNSGRPNLLDIGCSTGWITNVSREEGFDVTGLEANTHAAEYGKQKYGLNIVEGYLEDLETEKQYDAVTMFHVLEHITDPLKMLVRIHGLLNDNGKLLIVVPNSKSLGVGLFKRNYNWNIPHHISFFSPDTVKDILSRAGFKVLGVEHLISPPLLFYSYNKLMRQRKRKGKVFLLIRNRIMANILFFPLSLIGKLSGQGEVIAVYGEKI